MAQVQRPSGGLQEGSIRLIIREEDQGSNWQIRPWPTKTTVIQVRMPWLIDLFELVRLPEVGHVKGISPEAIDQRLQFNEVLSATRLS